MLSAMADDDVDECIRENAGVLAKKYPQFTPALLRKLVKQTRLRGYAVNEGLVLRGAWGLGAAVRSADGSVLGAFSIGAVESHLEPARQRKIGPLLQAEAGRLETHLRKLESLGPRARPLAVARRPARSLATR
jgi:DNA-binding IclR family transcriptional regulator